MTNKTTKTAPTGAEPVVAHNYFSRKIGNTTFVVSVLFNEKATDSMDDKILRLVASDIQHVSARRPTAEGGICETIRHHNHHLPSP